MVFALLLLGVQVQDTITIRSVALAPRPEAQIDSLTLGEPSVRMSTGQGTGLIWLLRAADTVFIAATIPDTTPYWGDDFVVSLDTQGDAATTPQHDDFQWVFRRVLDSSVVLRGRDGRWEMPRNDPDWRLGRERSGGGWEASGSNERSGWSVLLRMDPAWFTRETADLPRVAFRIYDNAPSGWFAWPSRDLAQPSAVERSPNLWVPAR